MPKMTIRIILKSGSEFAIKCDKFTITRNGFGEATGYNIEGITENKPVYLDFEQVAAVVRIYSGANGYDLFSRLHIRESGNPVRSRAASLHGRRRERKRSRALPFYGSYL